MLTIFGACAVTFLMLIYAFERRDRRFILAFACGCALSSVYGFLAGTWPFGVVEAIWAASRCVATRSPGISLDQLQLKAQAGRAAGNAAVTDGVDAILVSVLAVLALGQHETVKAV